MALALKYYHQYCDDRGNFCRVDILEEGFTGEAVEVEGQTTPFNATYESSTDFKFEPIRPSTANVGFVLGTDNGVDLEEFWTADERQFQVRHYVSISEAGLGTPQDLDWIGWLIPNGFQRQFRGGVYYADLQAADGLATLEGIPFKYTEAGADEPYGLRVLGYNDTTDDTFVFPFIEIATEILKKLDLNLDLWTCVDFYEANMTKSGGRDADPLAQAFANAKTYINDTDRKDIQYWQDEGAVWDCKRVLENLCRIFGAKVYQSKGVWRIKSLTADIRNINKEDSDIGQNPVWDEAEQKWRYKTFAYATPNIFNNFPSECELGLLTSTGKPLELYYTDEIITEANYASVTLYYKPLLSPIAPNTGTKRLLIAGSSIRIIAVDENITTYIDCLESVEPLQWRVYNTGAVFVTNYPLEPVINIPCKSLTEALIGNDHVVRMDEVYKAFRVNYQFQFVRSGDSPINLLENGDFTTPPTFQQAREQGPAFWENWAEPGRLNLAWVRVLNNDADLPAWKQNKYSLQIGRNALSIPGVEERSNKWTGIRQGPIQVFRGDELRVDMLCFYKSRYNNGLFLIYPTFKMWLVDEDGQTWYLRNNQSIVGNHNLGAAFDWTKEECFFVMIDTRAENYDPALNDQRRVYEFIFEVTTLPASGQVYFQINGLTGSQGSNDENARPFPVYFIDSTGVLKLSQTKVIKEFNFVHNGGEVFPLQVSGLSLGLIPETQDLPQSNDSIAFNDDGAYTFQDDPVRIFNGDTIDEKHISTIIIPNKPDQNVRSQWNNYASNYNDANIGLLLARAILSQYLNPNRIIEGTIMASDLQFDSLITIGALPGIVFNIQRGTINRKRNYLEDCTLTQIDIQTNVTNGTDSGNTTEPDYTPTGLVRCVKDGNGENTGEVEEQRRDINPNSKTFGNTIWTSTGVDVGVCPIGEATKFYWGCDDDPYTLANLRDDEVYIDPTNPDVYTLNYTNPGGKYIFLLHRQDLGLVNSVSTSAQNEIISDFQYYSDISIGGVAYKVMRQDYVTAQFDSIDINFTIN